MRVKEYECPHCGTKTKDWRTESLTQYEYYCPQCKQEFAVEKPPRYILTDDPEYPVLDLKKNKKLSDMEVIKRLNVMNERIKLLQSHNDDLNDMIDVW